jgi:hypothetical protein
LDLLSRAALQRERGEFKAARIDIDAAMRIAKYGSMRLHEADANLEYAKLFKAEGKLKEAREHFQDARDSIAHRGYSRRGKEVLQLEQQLS